MKNMILILSLAFGLVTLVSPQSAHATDYSSIDNGEYVGYLRVGAGTSAGGGSQNCYYLGNGDGHGYRLGNECDSYAEIGYARTFAKSDDDVRFVGHIMISDYSNDSAYSGTVGIAQIFVDAQGLDWLNGGTAWMGERYYERPDIHWMDLQYINLNGTGAGFDNIATGFLGSKFSYAIFKDNDTDKTTPATDTTPVVANSSNSAVRNNLLLRGIQSNEGGSVDLVVGVLTPSSPSSDRHGGYYLNAFHKQEVAGGGNLLGVQYGVGPGTGRGAPSAAYNPANPAAAFNGGTGGAGPDGPCCNRMGQSGSTYLGTQDTRLRVFDAIWIQPTKEFSMSFDALLQADKSPVYGGDTSTWTSFGVRPEYALFTHFKIQGEIGVDRVSYPGADAETLMKFTIAPTITLGPGFFDRPELRFFVTHANWNSAATATVSANTSNPGQLSSITSDTSVGFQLEAWWGKNWF